ncbi:MAG: hypothetical protein ACOY0T_05170 [Myxococcota bacterium]
MSLRLISGNTGVSIGEAPHCQLLTFLKLAGDGSVAALLPACALTREPSFRAGERSW